MAKKRGLGRGLDSLLGVREVIETAQDTRSGLQHIPVDQIARSPYQPRRVFDQDSLAELADSIRSQGILQPIVVRMLATDRYELVAGERRWRAVQLVGLAEIPAVVREIADDAAAAVALIENIQRENLNPIEQARALQRLQQEFGLTHEEVAQAVGKSRSSVTNLLRLNTLPEMVQQMLDNRQLEMGHARALLALTGGQLKAAAQQVVRKGLSVRQTESLVRSLQQSKPGATRRQENIDPDIRSLEQRLAERFGAEVRIDHQSTGSGRLSIKYSSAGELEGILRHLGLAE